MKINLFIFIIIFFLILFGILSLLFHIFTWSIEILFNYFPIFVVLGIVYYFYRLLNKKNIEKDNMYENNFNTENAKQSINPTIIDIDKQNYKVEDNED